MGELGNILQLESKYCSPVNPSRNVVKLCSILEDQKFVSRTFSPFRRLETGGGVHTHTAPHIFSIEQQLVKRGTSVCYVVVVFVLTLVTRLAVNSLSPNIVDSFIQSYRQVESTSYIIYIIYICIYRNLIFIQKSIRVRYNKGYLEHIKIYKFKSMIYINIK